jgi:hypothetical protein
MSLHSSSSFEFDWLAAIADITPELSAQINESGLDISNITDISYDAVENILRNFATVAVSDINQLFQSTDTSHLFSRDAQSSIFNRLVGIPKNAAAFTTLTNGGKTIDNGQGPDLDKQLKWTKSTDKADGTKATVVSFAFDDSFSVNGISTDRAKTLLALALQTWANYSLLDFVEVADPGAGDLVDILVQSSAIDGQGKTLAFAYFPTTGDITFDTSEVWSENKFLETAVHELGHSLGLDHEDDTPAIMNSILNNRYTDGAFLLEDDINGIRSLYGSGKGSVTSLSAKPSTDKPIDVAVTPVNTTSLTPTSTAPVPITNLVVNGSFEDVPLAIGESGVYSSIKGWSAISSVGFKVDRRPALVGQAADGTAWVELDTYGANNTMGQNIDTLTGQPYQISVDFSNGGRPESTTAVELFWEGKKLDTLSGGGQGRWKNFSYQVMGGDRKVSTLAFRAIGPIDTMGGFIDNIVITAAKEAIAPILDQGLGATPTFHRDPISGEPQNLVAAELNVATVPTEFI